MNIDNIEKCQILLEKRASLKQAAMIMGELPYSAFITIHQSAARGAIKVDLVDEELNMALQDAIEARIKAIEKQIEHL